MANEQQPEVIRQQMEAQRAALSDKLETLENRIVETVEGAREAVADTVDSVTTGVRDSMETVKDTVQTSVHAVQDSLDLPLQVERHPWMMFGGAVAVGFAVGYIVNRAGANACSSPRLTDTATRAPASIVPEAPVQHATVAAADSWAAQLTHLFGPEFQKLKGMAVGGLMGMVREMVADPLPVQMRTQVKEIVDSITTKLGGEPVASEVVEPLLPKRQHADHHNGHHRDDHGDTLDDDRRVVGR